MYDLTKSCFLCLNQDVHSLRSVLDGDQINFKLKFVVPELELFRPVYPVLVCRTCFVSLLSCYEFKTKCLKINQYIKTNLLSLKKHYNSHSQNTLPPYSRQINEEKNQASRTQTTVEVRNGQNLPPPYNRQQLHDEKNIQRPTEATNYSQNVQNENRQAQNIPAPYNKPQLFVNDAITRTQNWTEARHNFRTQNSNLVNEQQNTTTNNGKIGIQRSSPTDKSYNRLPTDYLNQSIHRTQTSEASNNFTSQNLANNNSQSLRNTIQNNSIQQASSSSNNRLYQEYLNTVNNKIQTMADARSIQEATASINKPYQYVNKSNYNTHTSDLRYDTNFTQNISIQEASVSTNNKQYQEHLNTLNQKAQTSVDARNHLTTHDLTNNGQTQINTITQDKCIQEVRAFQNNRQEFTNKLNHTQHENTQSQRITSSEGTDINVSNNRNHLMTQDTSLASDIRQTQKNITTQASDQASSYDRVYHPPCEDNSIATSRPIPYNTTYQSQISQNIPPQNIIRHHLQEQVNSRSSGFQIADSRNNNSKDETTNNSFQSSLENLIRHQLQEQENSRLSVQMADLRNNLRPESTQNIRSSRNSTNSEEDYRSVDKSTDRKLYHTNNEKKSQIPTYNAQLFRVPPPIRLCDQDEYIPLTESAIRAIQNIHYKPQDSTENRQSPVYSINQNNQEVFNSKERTHNNQTNIAPQSTSSNEQASENSSNSNTHFSNELESYLKKSQTVPTPPSYNTAINDTQNGGLIRTKPSSNRTPINDAKRQKIDDNTDKQYYQTNFNSIISNPSSAQINNLTKNGSSTKNTPITNLNQAETATTISVPRNHDSVLQNISSQKTTQTATRNYNPEPNSNTSISQNTFRSVTDTRNTVESRNIDAMNRQDTEPLPETRNYNLRRKTQENYNNLFDNEEGINTDQIIRTKFKNNQSESDSSTSSSTVDKFTSSEDDQQTSSDSVGTSETQESKSTSETQESESTSETQESESNNSEPDTVQTLLFSNDLKPVKTIKEEYVPITNNSATKLTDNETKNIELLFENRFQTKTEKQNITNKTQSPIDKTKTVSTSSHDRHKKFVEIVYRSRHIQNYVFKKFTTDPIPDPDDQTVNPDQKFKVQLLLELYRNGKRVSADDIDIKENLVSNKDDRIMYQELLDMETTNTNIKQDKENSKVTRTHVEDNVKLEINTHPQSAPSEIDIKENIVPFVDRNLYNDKVNENQSQLESDQPNVKEDIDIKENVVPYTDRKLYNDILNQENLVSNKDDRVMYQELLNMETTNTNIKQDKENSEVTRTHVEDNVKLEINTHPPSAPSEIDIKENIVPFVDRNLYNDKVNENQSQPESDQPNVKEDIDIKENVVPFTDRKLYNDILNQTEHTIKSEPDSESNDSSEPPTDITQNVTNNGTDIKEEMLVGTDIDIKFYQNLLNESNVESVASSNEINSEFGGCNENTSDGMETIDLTETPNGFVRCKICDIELPKQIMLYHLEIHGGIECKVCKKQFLSNYLMERHMKEFHAVKTYRCKCNKKFVNENDYNSHVKTHELLPHQCSICQKKFHSISGYKSHMYNTHAKEENKKLQCPQCDKKFLNQAHLKVHFKCHGEKRTNFDCDICGKHFVRAENLFQHKLIHKGEKKYECAKCNKKFLHKSHLKQHIPTHGGDKEFKCSECDKSFSYNCSLQKHMLVHEKSKAKRKKKTT